MANTATWKPVNGNSVPKHKKLNNSGFHHRSGLVMLAIDGKKKPVPGYFYKAVKNIDHAGVKENDTWFETLDGARVEPTHYYDLSELVTPASEEKKPDEGEQGEGENNQGEDLED